MNQEISEDLREILSESEGMHILLFDPDKLALEHTKSMLKQVFYTVIATGEQSLALKMLEDNTELIDLIMIDDKPQEMDCLSFIRKIKDVKENIPIVLLSSREVYLSATLIQIGACHVVSKPISEGEVMTLWKQANGWRAHFYMTLQSTLEDKAKRAMPLNNIDPMGKGKAVSFGLDASLYGDKDNKKKRDESCDEDDDDEDEKYGNGRKKSRVYTTKLHKKCMEILDQKAEFSVRFLKGPIFSASSTPVMPSSAFLNLSKDKAWGKPNKFSNIPGFQIPRAKRPGAMTLRSYPGKNLNFGFPMNHVLESTPVVQNPLQGMILSPSGSSTLVPGKGLATDPNDLSKFSPIVHAQSCFLATNGEYMRKKQLLETNLLNSNTTELLPSISSSSSNNNNNNISLSNAEGIINVEEDAFCGLSFAQTEAIFGSEVVFQENNNEVSLEEFLEGLLDKPEGSTSSSNPSSGMALGPEANAADHSQRPTLNLGSFTENGSSLPEQAEPMHVNDPFVQLNNFGIGMSPSDDLFDDITRQLSFEGLF